MPDIPKIVRERLKAASVTEHPDANLLSAFAENTLSGRERSTVCDHLSQCADCRDVVALALPATEALQTAPARQRRSWLTWPALRWGLVTAGVVAIASFGIVRYQHENRVQTASRKTAVIEAKNEAPSGPAVSANTDNSTRQQVPSPNAPQTAGRDRKPEHAAVAESKRTLLTNTTIGGPVPTQAARSLPHMQAPASVSPAFVKRQDAPSKDLRLPAANQTVEVSGAEVQVETAQNQPPASPAYDSSEPAVAKSKPAEAPQTGYAKTAAAAAPAPSSGTLVANQVGQARLRVLPPSALAPARWTISSAGALQRSFDQGQSWQDINVVASTASSDNLLDAQATAEVASTPADKQTLKKSAASPLTFRAVTSNGPDVWAGASQGMLFHSGDNGTHWTRVLPATAGVALSGDIVSLDFPDAQHGRVTTSTPEVWTTADGGHTWQKQ